MDISGITLMPLNHDHINLFDAPLPYGIPGVDFKKLLREEEERRNSATIVTTEDGLQTRASPETTMQQLVAVTRRCRDCPGYLFVLLIVLFSTGCITNVMGCAYYHISSRISKHRYSFVHLFVASFGSILFIPFTVLARWHDDWQFHGTASKALSFITCLSQVAVAFQLTHLAATRCKNLLTGKSTPSGCSKVIPFILWLIAAPIAAVTLIDNKSLSGVLKGDSSLRPLNLEIYHMVPAILGTLLPTLIIFVCIVAAFRGSRDNSADVNVKIKLGQLREMKEATLLYLLFLACCVPLQVYRAWAMSRVADCDLILNILVSSSALFSTLAPILHMVYVYSGSSSKSPKSSPIHKSKDMPTVTLGIERENGNVDEEKAV